MKNVPKITGILETALYVSDLTAADHFYGTILGLPKIAEVSGRHIFFKAGSSILLLFDPKATRIATPNSALPVPPHGAIGQGHVCFRASAAELDHWHSALSAKGIEIEADFAWPNGARSIYFRDPAGNSVEFAEPRLWSLD